jgi:carboxymethylenebutenolidase
MEVELSSGAVADLYPCVGASRGVVISTDLAGRRPLFDSLATRLALGHGWNVLVVDPFRNPPSQPNLDRPSAVSGLVDEDVVDDLVVAANRLEVEPVGLLGFGLGGMYALKASASHRFDRIINVGGPVRVPSGWQGSGQREPLQLLEHSADPRQILVLAGQRDPAIAPDDLDTLEQRGVEVVRYADAESDFVLDPDLATHRPNDAADAWTRVTKHLETPTRML